ncbi:hypothetical protein G5714_024639 [Onychostoma macrolepis]|uniref:Uncharacterized protein n=1 Tax=Onychostoma macrolepis TaxID=369639 RepID=A0A7J6BHL7_9TELE|nr:hypothetical protein G5714_024639 [Onychostoma macrolepis]
MSWRKGARRPVARRKSCRDRIRTGVAAPQGRVLTTMRSSSLGCRRAAQGATGVRLKIQLKDELAKRSPTSRCSTAKGCRDRIAAATTQSTNHYHDHGVPLAHVCKQGQRRVCPVQRGAHKRRGTCKKKHATSPRRAGGLANNESAGFEPALGDPNGFLVHRLNHSATTTGTCTPSALFSCNTGA